jgi:hypothetical protein
MRHEAAVAKLTQHAQQCEENAAIQRNEGNWKEADYNDGLAASYRVAIEALEAE